MECKMKVLIYGKEQCPYCVKAKNLAERLGHDYTYLQLGIDFEFPEFMERFPTARTFPQIVITEEITDKYPAFIGGYTEYEDSWNEKG